MIQTPIECEPQQGSAALNTSKSNVLIKKMEIIDTLTLRLFILCLQLASHNHFLEDLSHDLALLSSLPPVSPKCRDGGTQCVAESDLQSHLFTSRNTCALHSEVGGGGTGTDTGAVHSYAIDSVLLLPIKQTCEPLPPHCDSDSWKTLTSDGVLSQSCWVGCLSSHL